MVLPILSVIVSVFALVIAIISIVVQENYADKEYRYKLPPELDLRGRLGVQSEQEGGVKKHTANITDITIHILQKNNLEAAYVITADDEVKKLEIDEIENTLNEDMNTEIKMGNPNIVTGEITYHYMFLLLKGLDDSYELSLIYSKSEGENVEFNGISGIEIYGLKNSHPEDIRYTGEKEMAEKYLEVLSGYKKYSSQ